MTDNCSSAGHGAIGAAGAVHTATILLSVHNWSEGNDGIFYFRIISLYYSYKINET